MKSPVQLKKSYIIAAIILTFVLAGNLRSIQNLRNSGKKLNDTQAQIEVLRANNDNLRNDISYVQTEEYVEKAALERFHLTKDGQTILVMDPYQPPARTENDEIARSSASSDSPFRAWLERLNLVD